MADPAIALAIHLLAPLHTSRPISAIVPGAAAAAVAAEERRAARRCQQREQQAGQKQGTAEPMDCDCNYSGSDSAAAIESLPQPLPEHLRWRQCAALHQAGPVMVCPACRGGETAVCVQLWPDEGDERVSLLLLVHDGPCYPQPPPPQPLALQLYSEDEAELAQEAAAAAAAHAVAVRSWDPAEGPPPSPPPPPATPVEQATAGALLDCARATPRPQPFVAPSQAQLQRAAREKKAAAEAAAQGDAPKPAAAVAADSTAAATGSSAAATTASPAAARPVAAGGGKKGGAGSAKAAPPPASSPLVPVPRLPKPTGPVGGSWAQREGTALPAAAARSPLAAFAFAFGPSPLGPYAPGAHARPAPAVVAWQVCGGGGGCADGPAD